MPLSTLIIAAFAYAAGLFTPAPYDEKGKAALRAAWVWAKGLVGR